MVGGNGEKAQKEVGEESNSGVSGEGEQEVLLEEVDKMGVRLEPDRNPQPETGPLIFSIFRLEWYFNFSIY